MHIIKIIDTNVKKWMEYLLLYIHTTRWKLHTPGILNISVWTHSYFLRLLRDWFFTCVYTHRTRNESNETNSINRKIIHGTLYNPRDKSRLTLYTIYFVRTYMVMPVVYITRSELSNGAWRSIMHLDCKIILVISVVLRYNIIFVDERRSFL